MSTKKQALISILMPVKNADPWLEECLLSIHNQSFSDWELIAVNDHSKDKSLAILNDFKSRDERIIILDNPGNGIVDALNTALNESSGKYITRMDADDVMPVNKLRLFYEAIQVDPNAIVTGKVKYFAKNAISNGYLEYEQWLNERCDEGDHWKWIYRECVIASANWLAPRNAVIFDEGIYPEDYHMVLKWYAQQQKIITVNELTHHWREHPKRTSRNSKHYQQEAFFELKMRHFLDTDRDSSRPLMVMGKNQKAKLIQRFLKKRNIEYIPVDLEHLYRFAEVENPQILSAVFPDSMVRDGIVDLLDGFGLEMGRDWWWL
jgi:glycosyltransferase involved in cell wall biosynthesis